MSDSNETNSADLHSNKSNYRAYSFLGVENWDLIQLY